MSNSKLDQIAGDVKWFMFGDESHKMQNSDAFAHELTFVKWTTDHSFVVHDSYGNEYNIDITERIKRVDYGKFKLTAEEPSETVNATVAEIVKDVKATLEKYSSDNIDVVRNGDNMELYITFHSRHNSFPISNKTYPADSIDFKALERELDALNVGYVW